MHVASNDFECACCTMRFLMNIDANLKMSPFDELPPIVLLIFLVYYRFLLCWMVWIEFVFLSLLFLALMDSNDILQVIRESKRFKTKICQKF